MGGKGQMLCWAGYALVVVGLFFMAQGAGLIQWPASSSMLGARPWVYYGAGIALIGLLLARRGRRLR